MFDGSRIVSIVLAVFFILFFFLLIISLLMAAEHINPDEEWEQLQSWIEKKKDNQNNSKVRRNK